MILIRVRSSESHSLLSLSSTFLYILRCVILGCTSWKFICTCWWFSLASCARFLVGTGLSSGWSAFLLISCFFISSIITLRYFAIFLRFLLLLGLALHRCRLLCVSWFSLIFSLWHLNFFDVHFLLRGFLFYCLLGSFGNFGGTTLLVSWLLPHRWRGTLLSFLCISNIASWFPCRSFCTFASFSSFWFLGCTLLCLLLVSLRLLHSCFGLLGSWCLSSKKLGLLAKGKLVSAFA